MTFVKKKKKISKKTLLFYCAFMLWPVLQFAVFYIAVNFNSFLLAFKKVDANLNFIEWTIDHFSIWFKDGTTPNLRLSAAIVVSFKGYLISTLVGMPMGLLFSFYIFKRLPGSMFFRVMLYLPSVLSSLVLVLIYSYFVTAPFRDILARLFTVSQDSKFVYSEVKLMGRGQVSFATLMFYNLLVGFGVSVLLYANKMSSISPDLIEASELDGVNTWQEFFHIILPEVYPTISVFLITGIAGIFTNQYNAYPLTKGSPVPDSTTIGYLMYDNVVDAKDNLADVKLAQTAALGLMLSAVVIPTTFLVRHLLLKYGPSED